MEAVLDDLLEDPSPNHKVDEEPILVNGVNGKYNDDCHRIEENVLIQPLTVQKSTYCHEQQLKQISATNDNIMEVDFNDCEAKLPNKGKYADKDSDSSNFVNNLINQSNDNSGEVTDEDQKCIVDEKSDGSMEVDKSNSSDIECLDDKDDNRNGSEIVPDSSRKYGSHNDSIEATSETLDGKACEENGSCGSPDIEEITDGAKSNGMDIDDQNKDITKKKANKKFAYNNITPRRSSRNIKRTSYTEDKETEEVEDSSDIEEIKPVDPLGDVEPRDNFKKSTKNISPSNSKTIVVNDTKRLVEIAAGSKCSKGGKKEPTLVIIDTNSILSGKGGVPVTVSKSNISSHHPHSHHTSISNSTSFSMVPINASQSLYPNMRTTITPVSVPSKFSQLNPKTTISPIISIPPPTMPPQILPTLTDDMFVVEAPSFIVPYVYEKPPIKPLKEFISKLKSMIEEADKLEKEEQLKKKKIEIDVSDVESSGDKCKKDGDNSATNSNFDLTEKTISGDEVPEDKTKSSSYFDSPLGKFFIQIGVNLVQEFVQTDLLRTQKRKHNKSSASAETQMAINSLIKNLEFSKENNEPFHFEMKKCEFCNFKTESSLVMQHHLETPHMRNYMYKCNFCPAEVRSPHEILFHMEEEHNTRGRLERGPAFHQCPNCPFEDNQKGKLSRHILACTKKFRPERNCEPTLEWEPPAKIPRINRPRQLGTPNVSSAFAMAMAAKNQPPLLPKLLPAQPIPGRGRGRPPMQPRFPDVKSMGRPGTQHLRPDNLGSMMYRPSSSGGLMIPNTYQMANNQLFQVVGSSGTVISALSGVSSSSRGSSGRPTPITFLPSVSDAQSRLLSSQNTTVTAKTSAAKLMNQPSISITPLPRTTPQSPLPGSGASKSAGKNTFVICEICDGYIKDLEQLRNHMQWIHKVKIHPKMIYNRPPLNCQKCQFRFFTDQGLERHLLGSHGLVTSSMQEAANKGKDSGRCPTCGRVYQWKLLNHVARDHGMTLKPAHLSYKCTVCTATFGMYKQFENHVYSAHSVVAKRVMDKKSTSSSPAPRTNDSLLKPLKINDEITIIPQPPKASTRTSQGKGK